jgi:hypothetical protein
MIRSKLEVRECKIKKHIPGAIFKDGVLISPLPTVKFGHRIRTEVEFIELAFVRYSVDTVIEAMLNNKIILNL